MYNDKVIYKVVIWECFWISLWKEKEALTHISLNYYISTIAVLNTLRCSFWPMYTHIDVAHIARKTYSESVSMESPFLTMISNYNIKCQLFDSNFTTMTTNVLLHSCMLHYEINHSPNLTQHLYCSLLNNTEYKHSHWAITEPLSCLKWESC